MVQGLAFLCKKSWNTKNKANQEKVWLAEERQRQEEIKTKELAKQIQQERDWEELHGRKDRGIDWMYNGHLKNSETAQADAAKQAEDFLLGKEVASMNQAPVEPEPPQGVNAVVAAVDHSVDQEPSVHERNEQFRMRYEDPMYSVAQVQQEQDQKTQARARLYETVGVELVEKKKKKKKKKHRKRHVGSDDDSYEERRRRKKHRSRRDRSPDRHSDESSYDSRRRHNRKYRKRSPDRKRDRYIDDDESVGSQRRRHDRDSRGPRYRSRSRDRRSKSPESYRRESRRDRYKRSNSIDRKDSGRVHERPLHKDGYGLQGGGRVNLNDLGPDQGMLRQKRQEQSEIERQRREESSKRRYRTPQEREEALRRMEMDADYRRSHPNHHDRKQDHGGPSGDASFLREMNEKLHGVRGGGASLSDRIRENRNHQQRRHESFM